MVKARGNLLVYIISMVVITLWGLSYIWNDQLLAQGVRVEYFVFVRTVIGSLLLLVMNLLMGKSIKMDMKDLPYFLLLAVCEPLVYFTCETYGIQLTESPTYSALIIAATPIVATIAGILFFKEKLRPMNYFGIAVCLAGLVLVTLSADTIKKGKSVIVNAKATGGTGGYTYGVYYKKQTATKWAAAQSYKANSTITVTPARTAAYSTTVPWRRPSGHTTSTIS